MPGLYLGFQMYAAPYYVNSDCKNMLGWISTKNKI
jgi:hypothetical protein